MSRTRRWKCEWARRDSVGVVALALTSICFSGCGFGTDSEPPKSVAPYLEAARESLTMHQDGVIRSRFWFRSAQCRNDGGMLLLFDQVGPFGSQGLAVAMSANPRDDAGAWAGGFAPVDPETNPEIEHFFSEVAEVPCD